MAGEACGVVAVLTVRLSTWATRAASWWDSALAGSTADPIGAVAMAVAGDGPADDVMGQAASVGDVVPGTAPASKGDDTAQPTAPWPERGRSRARAGAPSNAR